MTKSENRTSIFQVKANFEWIFQAVNNSFLFLTIWQKV